MRMFCAALSRDGSLGSLSPDRNLGVSPPSKLDKLRCEPIFVIKHLEIQDLVYVYNLSRCAGLIELIGNFIITSTKPEFLFIRRVTTKHKLGYRLVLCLVVLMLLLMTRLMNKNSGLVLVIIKFGVNLGLC